ISGEIDEISVKLVGFSNEISIRLVFFSSVSDGCQAGFILEKGVSCLSSCSAWVNKIKIEHSFHLLAEIIHKKGITVAP
ncbi:14764_t:CDS:2, partial [Gigaspora rosea]